MLQPNYLNFIVMTHLLTSPPSLSRYKWEDKQQDTAEDILKNHPGESLRAEKKGGSFLRRATLGLFAVRGAMSSSETVLSPV